MMTKNIYRFTALTALIVAGPVSAETPGPQSEQTKNGTIIWHAPENAKAAPGKDAIIWDNDAKAPAPTPAPTSAKRDGVPDRNGIIWNDPPGSAPTNAAKAEAPSSAQAPTPQADAAGPCREFESDIIIEGSRQPMRGTACRQPDGRWRVVSQAPR